MAESVSELRRFLEVLSYRDNAPQQPERPSGFRPFITISRETGAGAHSLAQALLERFSREESDLFRGWQIVDRELCERVLSDERLTRSVQQLISDEYRSEVEDAILTMLGETPQDVVIRHLFETIRTLASVGRVIVLGRGGMCVTRDLAGGVHLRLVASVSSRVSRIMRVLNAPQSEAKRVVANQDHNRARLVNRYFARDIEDPLLYDATWNTDAASFDAIAGTVVALIQYRSAHQGELAAPALAMD